MLHLVKYRFLQIIRDYSSMFWALAFPIILGTFFYISFGQSGMAGSGEVSWNSIPVAVIQENTSSESAKAFEGFLDKMGEDTLDIQDIGTEKEALKMLKEDKINGIFYVDETPSLTVSKSEINESILTSLLDTYNKNASMIKEIASTHPEKLPQALEAMNDYRNTVKEESLGGSTLDPNIQYFFALIAYACLSGAFLGVNSSFDSQANLSPLAARRSITPTHKMTLILVDMFVLFIIHFINILILTAYVMNVLGVSLGDNIGALLLIDLMGSVIGVSLGITFGAVGKLSKSLKISLTVAITLFPGFLAGLMFGSMKNLIEKSFPIINRINPAAVLSDAFYCLSVYNDMDRFIRCLFILGIMSIGLLFTAFLSVRRERYDYI